MDSNTFSPQTLTFQPNLRVGGIIISIILVCLSIGGIVLLWFYLPPICVVPIGLLLVFCAFLGAFSFWHQLKANIQVNSLSIWGHNGAKSFKFDWHEVSAIHHKEAENQNYYGWLVLSAQSDQVSINLDDYDGTAVWEAIQTYAPTPILEPDADLNIMQLPVQISVSLSYHIFYIVMFFFISFVFWLSLVNEIRIAAAFCLVLAFVFFYLILLGSGKFEANSEAITIIKLWGHYQLQWSEIRFLEVNGYNGWYVFHGENKHLCMPSPNLWTGSRKDDFYLLLENQIEERQIEVKTNWKAPFCFNKNVRVL